MADQTAPQARHSPLTAAAAGRLLRIATAASVATAVLLIVVKMVGWLMTGSVSLMAALVDSMMDALASLLNLLAVRYALTPADDEHRFGHGKAESLAGLGQATFIAGSALFLILHAVARLLNPEPLAHLGLGIAIMVFSIVATLALLALQRSVIRRTGSTAIRADSLHYLGDLLANLAIILALGLASLGWSGFDPVFAIGVAGYILYTAWSIGMEATHALMDRELSEAVQAQIQALASAHPSVRGVHDLRTRQSGPEYFIQMHIELDDGILLVEAHRISDEVEARIEREFPNADVIIHQDPVSLVRAGLDSNRVRDATEHA